MRTIFLFLLLSASLFTSCKKEDDIISPQVPPASIATAFLTLDRCIIIATATDQEGNIYVTGNGSAVFDTQSLPEFNGMFLAKYTSSRKLIWVKTASGKLDNAGTQLVLDEFGNVYVSGYYRLEATFGETVLKVPDGLNGLYRYGFVAKYTTTGEMKWVQNVGIIQAKEINFRGTHYALAVDASGNLYMTGHFHKEAIFGSQTLSTSTSGDFYTSDIFVAKYAPSGEVLWVRQAGGKDQEQGTAIVVDATQNVYVTGYFYGTTNFDGIRLTVNQGQYYRSDIFVAKYNATGQIEWVRKAGGIEGDLASCMVLDKVGNVYVSGCFSRTATFNTFSVTSQGVMDAFLAKYTPSGEVSWVKTGGSTEDYSEGNDGGTTLWIDEVGQIYWLGKAEGHIIFDQLTLREDSNYYDDYFMIKMKPSGEIISGHSVPLIIPGKVKADVPDIESGYTASVMRAGEVYVTNNYKTLWKLKL